MKRICVLAVIFCTIGCVYGQNEKKKYLGGHYTLGASNYHNSVFSGFSSAAVEMKNYYGIGIEYEYSSSESYSLCLGMTFTFNNGIHTSSQWTSDPNGTRKGKGVGTISFFSFPAHFKYHFSKYVFVGGGPCLNIHTDKAYAISSLFGAGLTIMCGIEYEFKSGLAVSIVPRRQWNWVNFFKSDDSSKFDPLTQTGVNIRLGYRF